MTTTPIIIDGSHGEGGGQMLRTSLGLSMLTGQPFVIENIRANRQKPGLMRQHLACVLAAAEICSASVDGASIGSRRLSFAPGAVRPGNYHFATGSAGSTTLVLQAVLPSLLTAGGPSTITLEGGTHNPFAPPLDFVDRAFLRCVSRMGPEVEISVDRLGFFPAGGGRWTVRITPATRLSRIDIPAIDQPPTGRCIAIVAALPVAIAEREIAVVRRHFNWPDDAFIVREQPKDQGPGNVLMIELTGTDATEIITGFGERGVRAETIGEQVATEALRFIQAAVPVGEHLADQLLIPMAIAGGGSFVTCEPTLHTRTNIDVIRKFMDVKIDVTEESPGRWRISVQ